MFISKIVKRKTSNLSNNKYKNFIEKNLINTQLMVEYFDKSFEINNIYFREKFDTYKSSVDTMLTIGIVGLVATCVFLKNDIDNKFEIMEKNNNKRFDKIEKLLNNKTN